MSFTMGHGYLVVFAVFRCSCGRVAGMADQTDGNAAMVHEAPHCPRFQALETLEAGMTYFRSLDALPMTEEALGLLSLDQSS